MTITPNHAKERLKQGKTSLGFQIRRLYGPDIVRMAKACDYDHLFIDMEHGAIDLENSLANVRFRARRGNHPAGPGSRP